MQMRRQMQEKQHLPRYKGVRVSCHDEQLFWHRPVHLLRCSRNPKALFRLYLGIKIYRQSTRIIFGAHVAHSLLWNTLTYFMRQSLICWTWIPVFYTLTKIHKPNPVWRPIIWTNLIICWLPQLLQPIAKVQESYLNPLVPKGSPFDE